MKLQSDTEHCGRDVTDAVRRTLHTDPTDPASDPPQYLDMLGDVFVVLLLVFEAPVTGVTEMGKLWFLLISLLWVKGQLFDGIYSKHTELRTGTFLL